MPIPQASSAECQQTVTLLASSSRQQLVFLGEESEGREWVSPLTRIKTGNAARTLDRNFGRRGHSSAGVGEVGGGDVNDYAIAEDD